MRKNRIEITGGVVACPPRSAVTRHLNSGNSSSNRVRMRRSCASIIHCGTRRATTVGRWILVESSRVALCRKKRRKMSKKKPNIVQCTPRHTQTGWEEKHDEAAIHNIQCHNIVCMYRVYRLRGKMNNARARAFRFCSPPGTRRRHWRTRSLDFYCYLYCFGQTPKVFPSPYHRKKIYIVPYFFLLF